MSDSKKKGRSKKSPDEIRAAFTKLTNALGLEGLSLYVNEAVPANDPTYGRSVVLGSNGEMLFSNISGTELVSACERAYDLTRYATKLHTHAVVSADAESVAS